MVMEEIMFLLAVNPLGSQIDVRVLNTLTDEEQRYDLAYDLNMNLLE